VDLDDAARMEEKMRRGQFTLEDMLEQMRAMKKLGPLENLVRMLPGASDMMQGDAMSKGEREMRRMEGIICSMTFARAPQPEHSQRQTASAHRQGQWHPGLGGQQSAQPLRPDAADDEEDGQAAEDDVEDGRGNAGWTRRDGRDGRHA
jgi:hypothetical protein